VDDAAPIPEPIAQPVAQQAAEPVAEPVAPPVPVAEPVAPPPAEAVAEPVAAPFEPAATEPSLEPPAGQPAAVATTPTSSSGVSVRDIVVRVGAELGRATLPLSRAVGLAPGSVIELDRAADDPIDLYVNGRRFATGQLLLLDQAEWAIRIERVLDVELGPDNSPSGDDLI
jgi:flagellar motor switch protein FliN